MEHTKTAFRICAQSAYTPCNVLSLFSSVCMCVCGNSGALMATQGMQNNIGHTSLTLTAPHRTLHRVFGLVLISKQQIKHFRLALAREQLSSCRTWFCIRFECTAYSGSTQLKNISLFDISNGAVSHSLNATFNVLHACNPSSAQQSFIFSKKIFKR